jgi:hypothetical protein
MTKMIQTDDYLWQRETICVHKETNQERIEKIVQKWAVLIYFWRLKIFLSSSETFEGRLMDCVIYVKRATIHADASLPRLKRNIVLPD